MKNVIFNADDFGLHPDVNAGIIRAYQHGVLTSTSVMAVGEALDEAVQLLRANPGLDTSVHITLVAERPVLPVDEVPSLVDETGHFWPDYMAFAKRYFLGKISKDELRAECEAQIARLEYLGIHPSHLDSHQHLHVLPGILDICLDLMEAHGIRRMRLPAETYGFTGGFHAGAMRKAGRDALTYFAHRARKKAAARGIWMPDGFYGMLSGGNTDEHTLLSILRAIHAAEGEIFEIMQHPGMTTKELSQKYPWGYHWTQERAALTSPAVKEFLRDYEMKAVSFAQMGEHQPKTESKSK